MPQSLQEWLAAQREQLAAEHTEVIPIPGYEARLAGRYELLHLTKAEEIMHKSSSNLDRAADTLIWSCVELLELVGEDDEGKPIYRSTGSKWTREGVRKVFGIELPDDATSRDAVFAVFPGRKGPYKLVQHFSEIDARLSLDAEEIAEEIRGNSDARSAEEEPSISR